MTAKRQFNKLTPAQHERLALLFEEAGEIVQAVGKIMRHGYESRHPHHPGPTNRTALCKEVGDLMAAVDLLVARNDLDGDLISGARSEKHRTVAPYLHHQPKAKNGK